MSRWVYYIAEEDYVDGEGYMVSIVSEDEPGRRLTGTWPYSGGRGEKLPYFWGDDYDIACKIAREKNNDRGISEDGEIDIISSSMRIKG